MKYALIYIFDADKKRTTFMLRDEEVLVTPEYQKTYQLKLKGIEDWQVYRLLDILTHYPNEPRDAYSESGVRVEI